MGPGAPGGPAAMPCGPEPASSHYAVSKMTRELGSQLALLYLFGGAIILAAPARMAAPP